MDKKDFMQLLWVMPFLGGFMAFIIASVLKTGEAASGIMIILGVLAGSITLLTYVLGLRVVNSEEKTCVNNKTE